MCAVFCGGLNVKKRKKLSRSAIFVIIMRRVLIQPEFHYGGSCYSPSDGNLQILTDAHEELFSWRWRANRNKFSAMIDEIGLQQPAWKELTTTESAVGFASMGEKNRPPRTPSQGHRFTDHGRFLSPFLLARLLFLLLRPSLSRRTLRPAELSLETLTRKLRYGKRAKRKGVF